MADINTSIKIGADASQAITEMQRLQSVTQQVKTTGENINIAPKVDATAVDALKNTIASTAVEVPVTVKTQVEGAAAAAGAAQQPTAGPIASNFAAEQRAAAGMVDLQNQIANNAINADSKVIALKEKLRDIGIEGQKAVGRLANAVLQMENLEGAAMDVPGSVTEEEWKKAEAAVKKYDEEVKKLRASAEATKTELNQVTEAVKNQAAEANKASTAMGGFRGAMYNALEGYKQFSSGANSGMESLKSLSLNILADIELVKRAAKTFYDLGGSIYSYATTIDKSLGMVANRSIETEKAFLRLGLAAKAPTEAIKELDAKISELSVKIAEVQDISFGDALDIAYQNDLIKKGTEDLNKQKAAAELLRAEFVKMREEAAKRAADRSGLALLDEETRIRKQAEYDIADLKDQLALAENENDKANIQIRIDNRKKILDKDLKDFKDNEQKKKDEEAKRIAEEAKRKAEETKRIQDEARAAEIANLTDQAKIEQSYLFDLDKINRRLAAAQTAEERNALIALAKARKAQRDREMKDYNDAQKKAMDENAAQMKEAARENAEYQKSLMEELVGYQRQLVASFSGLQQSIFPKEAMNYLRQIAGASNRLPP